MSSTAQEMPAGIWSAAGQVLGVQAHLPPLRHSPRPGGAPLSPAQERLWYLTQSEPDTCYYNVPLGWWIDGELDEAGLEGALRTIVSRHECLRTSFRTEAGRPGATITSGSQLDLHTTDLERLPLEERPAVALRMAGDFIRRPFDLAQAPLLRAGLWRLEPARHLLVLTMHQIVFDGWSMRVLSRELAALYAASRQAQPPPLAPLPLQYADFAAWQRQWLGGDAMDGQLAYWRHKLGAAYAPLDLPTDSARLPADTALGGRQAWVAGQAATASLARLGREEDATLFAAVMAVLQSLLFQYTGQEDIMVFTSTAGRNRLEVRPLIGLFANVLPLRTDLSGNPSFRQLLRRVRDVIGAAFAHQDLPFETILSALPAASSQRRTPFQVMTIYQNAPLPRLQLPGATFTPADELDNGAAKFDLLLEIANDPARGLRGAVKYRADLYESSTILVFLRDFQRLLENACAAPDQSLAELAGGLRKRAPVRAEAGPPSAFVAPRDALEWQLAEIWQKAFRLARIGVADDFFDLGGHSLLAARLFAEIEKRTGRVLPLVTIIQAPTIERLAAILRQEGWTEPWSCLVPLKPMGSRLPFYCVHGRDGNVVEFSSLIRYCDADQPFYGIQAQGLDGKTARLRSVEEMAAHYIDEIQQLQPRGPYHLGGSSFGGLVAYEMAQQLTARGEQVGLLVVFDTHAPGYPRYLPRMTAVRRKLMRLRFRVELHWTNLKSSPGKRWEYITVKSSRLVKHTQARMSRKYKALKRRLDNLLLPRRIRDVQESGCHANRTYIPKPYPGKLTLFRATQQPYGIHPDRTNGWGHITGGEVEIHDIPGHHGSIVYEPRVRYLVRELMDALAAAQAGRARAALQPKA